MPEKDPANWGAATWLLLIGMTMLGGISSWYRRVKAGHTRAFNLVEMIGEAATSGLMGFVGFATADFYFNNYAVAAAFAGMCAHFSTRLLFQAEGLLDSMARAAKKKIEKNRIDESL